MSLKAYTHKLYECMCMHRLRTSLQLSIANDIRSLVVYTHVKSIWIEVGLPSTEDLLLHATAKAEKGTAYHYHN